MGVLAPVFGLALLDSLNPSAIAITLYLLLSGGSFVPRVISYAAGIFSANLVLGAALMLGLGSVAGYFDGPVAYGAQGVSSGRRSWGTRSSLRTNPRRRRRSAGRAPSASAPSSFSA